MMTKRHFDALASVLKETEATPDVIHGVALVCHDANPNFDRTRFFRACGLTHPTLHVGDYRWRGECERCGVFYRLTTDSDRPDYWCSRCDRGDGVTLASEPEQGGATLGAKVIHKCGAADAQGCEPADLVARCGRCGSQWCSACDPAPDTSCHRCDGRGYTTSPIFAYDITKAGPG